MAYHIEWTVMVKAGPAVGGANAMSLSEASFLFLTAMRQAFGDSWTYEHEQGFSKVAKAINSSSGDGPWTWRSGAVLVVLERQQ